MKRMKKILALLLASVMVLGLAACGGDNTPAEDTDAGTKEPATTTETSANDILQRGHLERREAVCQQE